jgi:hypothetical protein
VGELRCQLRAQSGIAGADEEQGEILDTRVVADEHGAANLTVEVVQQPQQGVGVRQVDLVGHVNARSPR